MGSCTRSISTVQVGPRCGPTRRTHSPLVSVPLFLCVITVRSATSMCSVDRRTALITGGTRGIGFGIARALAHDGWTLGLGGIRPEGDVQAALDELRALGAVVHYLRGDLALRDDRTRLAA